MKREGCLVTERLLALGDPPVDAKYYTVLDKSEAILLKSRVSEELVTQIVDEWIYLD
jgi:hypothetical protein